MNMRYVCRRAPSCAFIGLVLFLVGCQNSRYGADLPDPNGRLSEMTNEYPAVVLVVAPENSGICTGTFISERAVLTAAHCTDKEGTYTVATSFGYFRTSERVNFGPGEVDDPNDISILVFDQPVASRDQGQVLDLFDDVREGDTLRLVGFGCNDINTRRGSGYKRTGTNVVAAISDYIEFLTPRTTSGRGMRGIIGPENRAGSCFGDSGGPALLMVGGEYRVVGVTHAGGPDGRYQVSEYVNVATRSDNRSFIAQVNRTYGLDIRI